MRQTKYFPFSGGLNLETPALSIKAGELIDCVNFEADLDGGYRRINGFERTDGQLSPSESTYYTIDFSNGENEVFQREVVSGSISGAMGKVLETVIEAGSWSSNDASGYIVIRMLSGTFEVGEEIRNCTPEGFTTGFSCGFR